MSNVFDSMLPVDDEKQPDANQTGSELATESTSPELEISTASVTPMDVKEATQELLKIGFIEESRKSALFQKATIHRQAILSALEPLDLTFQVDSYRGIAFLKVNKTTQADSEQDDQEWSHPLVRRQRLTLEQSLVIAILRKCSLPLSRK